MTTELSLFSTEPKNEPAAQAATPLAHRLRPETLEEFVGHEQLLGPGKPLREAIETARSRAWCSGDRPAAARPRSRVCSRATRTGSSYFSAVTEGVPRVREIIREAEQRRRVKAAARSLLRRDPSLQSRAAGCVPTVGRSRRDHADRRDDREPVVRAQLRALVAPARVRARAARRAEAMRAIVVRGWQKLAPRRPAACRRSPRRARSARAARRRRRAPRAERDRGAAPRRRAQTRGARAGARDRRRGRARCSSGASRSTTSRASSTTT